MDWWLIVNTPSGVHCWPVGGLDHTAAVLAAKSILGVPPGPDPMVDASPWDVQLTCGEPHPTLLAQATIRETTELHSVDPAALAAYAAAEAAAHSGGYEQAVREALAALDDARRSAVLAEYTDQSAPAPMRGT